MVWWACSKVYCEIDGVKLTTGLIIWILCVTALPIFEAYEQFHVLLDPKVETDRMWNLILNREKPFPGPWEIGDYIPPIEEKLFSNRYLYNDKRYFDADEEFWKTYLPRKHTTKNIIHSFNLLVIIVTGLFIYFYEYRWLWRGTKWIHRHRGPLWIGALLFYCVTFSLGVALCDVINKAKWDLDDHIPHYERAIEHVLSAKVLDKFYALPHNDAARKGINIVGSSFEGMFNPVDKESTKAISKCDINDTEIRDKEKDKLIRISPPAWAMIFLECLLHEGDPKDFNGVIQNMTQTGVKKNYAGDVEYRNRTPLDLNHNYTKRIVDWARARNDKLYPLFQYNGRDYDILWLRHFTLCPQDVRENLLGVSAVIFQVIAGSVLPILFFFNHLRKYYLIPLCKGEPIGDPPSNATMVTKADDGEGGGDGGDDNDKDSAIASDTNTGSGSKA